MSATIGKPHEKLAAITGEAQEFHVYSAGCYE